jgi:hypothetical protein
MEMKTLLLGVGLGALIGLSALTTPAQTKQTTPALPPDVRRGSATLLREYHWKLRTEVQRKGETKSVQVAQVRYDLNGQMQTTVISKTPEPDLPKFGLRKAIAEKKFKEFKETVQQLGDLARAYGNLSPEQTQQFMASALITPEINGGQKLLRAEGHDVFQNRDTMIVWLDAITRKQRRIEIHAAYDGKPVRIDSEFRDLPQGGPTYLATSQVAYDDGEVVIVTTNFDHERLRAESAAAAAPAAAAPATDNGWPRKFAVGGSSFAVYQPQMERWEGNQWLGRAAFSVANGSAGQPSYGVLWFEARTEIDKAKRLVSFSDIRVTRVSFPAAPEKTSLLQNALQSHARQRGEAIALDRLLAEMAANDAARPATTYEVKNEAPKVFFSTKPALLVLIDGAPVFRQVQETELETVINTHVLIVRDRRNNFYLHLLNGWLQADDLMSSWRPALQTPKDLAKALDAAIASKQVDLLNGPKEGISLNDAARANQLPEIYLSTEPAELLQTDGDPQIASIPNTELVYVTNTENDIFVHTTTQTHYILLAGRWFSAQSMRGPWTYVAADKLPADFAQIPATHEKANVLVSVAGTPQAKEALIANSIPQTETVARGTTINVSYDGTPQFKPIENTTLQYAVNTSTPVIVVNSTSYYAVYNGVWFVATSAAGPWAVAATVPTIIYSIPVSSPLHYVTYVKIYGSTPEVVYVGYTPGYYGTIVTSSNVVVYGTGWYYPPYVGAYWYGAPYTYGYGVVFNWGVASGWGYAYANSNYYASGTRAAWANAYTGNVGYANAYARTTANGTRYAARGFTNTNVYTGTTAKGGGAVAYNPNTGRIAAGQAGAVSNPYTGNGAAGARGVTYNPNTGVISGGAVGGVRNGSTGAVTTAGSAFAYNPNTNKGVAVTNNNVYADRNGNIYRYNQSTGVQQRTDNGWETVQRSQDRSWVQNQHQARSLGQERTQNFSSLRSGARPDISSAPGPNFANTPGTFGSGARAKFGGGPRGRRR